MLFFSYFFGVDRHTISTHIGLIQRKIMFVWEDDFFEFFDHSEMSYEFDIVAIATDHNDVFIIINTD
jgi:hypothetical protein